MFLTTIWSLFEKDHCPGAKVMDSFSDFFHCCCWSEIKLKKWETSTFLTRFRSVVKSGEGAKLKKSWHDLFWEFLWLIFATTFMLFQFK